MPISAIKYMIQRILFIINKLLFRALTQSNKLIILRSLRFKKSSKIIIIII